MWKPRQKTRKSSDIKYTWLEPRLNGGEWREDPKFPDGPPYEHYRRVVKAEDRSVVLVLHDYDHNFECYDCPFNISHQKTQQIKIKTNFKITRAFN